MVHYTKGWVYSICLPADTVVITTLMNHPETDALVIPPIVYAEEWVKMVAKYAVKTVNDKYSIKSSVTKITVTDNVISFKLRGDLEVVELMTEQIIEKWEDEGVTLQAIDLDL